jgi:CPA1 family monovalent cation:H+ antiporter
MRAIDDYTIEVLIALAAVMATYSLAGKLHLSGPIAVVCAGILIGERGPRDAMSETTQRYIFEFWTLTDALLNIVLFFLIGIEALVLRPGQGLTTIALMAIPIVLLARWVAVALPVTALRFGMFFRRGTIRVLIWGGVRGGISIALVLSMPDFPQRPMVLAATYTIVIVSVVIQCLTLGPPGPESRRSRLTPPLSLESPASNAGTSKQEIDCSEFTYHPQLARAQGTSKLEAGCDDGEPSLSAAA